MKNEKESVELEHKRFIKDLIMEGKLIYNHKIENNELVVRRMRLAHEDSPFKPEYVEGRFAEVDVYVDARTDRP